MLRRTSKHRRNQRRRKFPQFVKKTSGFDIVRKIYEHSQRIIIITSFLQCPMQYATCICRPLWLEQIGRLVYIVWLNNERNSRPNSYFFFNFRMLIFTVVQCMQINTKRVHFVMHCLRSVSIAHKIGPQLLIFWRAQFRGNRFTLKEMAPNIENYRVWVTLMLGCKLRTAVGSIT